MGRYGNRKTHGMSGSKLYRSWSCMKGRCTRKDLKDYSHKNLKYHDGWETFVGFMEWAMANGYRDGLSIDRKDNLKGYYPENCRWATAREQAINRTTTIMIEHDGKVLCKSQWAEELDLPYWKFLKMYKKYENIADILKYKDERNCKLYEVGDERLSLKEIAEKFNINIHTLTSRISRGYSLRDMIAKPFNLSDEKRYNERYITVNGERVYAKELAKKGDLPIYTINKRLRQRWAVEDLLKPAGYTRRYKK